MYAPCDGSGQGDPVQVALTARDEAERTERDMVIVDTADRLAVDAEMMAQAAAIKDAVAADEVLLVVDAMTGQDAVNTALAFQEGVDVTGVVLSKLDGDARGGAALSITSVTGRPIKFAATGEKLADFDAFHPDRLAGGSWAWATCSPLIERAGRPSTASRPPPWSASCGRRPSPWRTSSSQLQQVKKMGPLNQVLGMLPGVGRQLKDVDVDDREIARVEAIVQSMTPAERRDPKILNGSRRGRIARGSARPPSRWTPGQAVRRDAQDDEAAVGAQPQAASPHGPRALRRRGIRRSALRPYLV